MKPLAFGRMTTRNSTWTADNRADVDIDKTVTNNIQ